MTTLARDLTRLRACSEAIEWVREQRGTRQEVWDRCPNADWMLWIAGHFCGERGSKAHRALILAACACARTSLRFVPDGETRPRAAIKLVEQWAHGDNTISMDQIKCAAEAAEAAWAAAWAARAAACAAAPAARAAAWAAWAAACAAAPAARAAAWAAGASGGAGASGASWEAVQKRMAKIVRKFIQRAPKIRRKR